MNDNSRDDLYSGDSGPRDFVFDERVARVFNDMINRSVPGYSTIISMIGVLADRYCSKGSMIYDLGCSLGAATLAMDRQIAHNEYRIEAVDSSDAMIARLREKLRQESEAGHDVSRINPVCADIIRMPISNASVVVLNFTLQFVPLAERHRLLRAVYAGMQPGGILILSEKVLLPDANLNELFVEMYHLFKEKMGYSGLEISRKRTALENVLIPESIETHQKRLGDLGFKSVDVWFKCFNFASLVAFK
ncbi:MAG: carboxy-S-adenosyl-L-methionine synthase CmoA [Pseudohongiellaceae bacterium]